MTETSINISDLFKTIKDKWKVIILVTFMGVALAAVFSFFIVKPVYRVTSSLYVGNMELETEFEDGFEYKREVESFMLLMPTYKEIAMSNAVMTDVLAKTGSQRTLFELENMAKIWYQGGTQVLNFQIDSHDVNEAIAMADQFIASTSKISEETRGVNLVQTLDKAIMPEFPITPIHTNNIILGAILGFMLSLALVVGQEIYRKLRKRRITL